MHAPGVAPRAGFGQAPGSNNLAGRQSRQPLGSLRLGTELVDMLGAQTVMSGQGQPNASAYLGNFVDDGDIFGITQPGSAVFGVNQHTHETHLPHGVKNMQGKRLGLIPLHDMGRDVLYGKIPCSFADGVEVGMALGLDRIQNNEIFKDGKVSGLHARQFTF